MAISFLERIGSLRNLGNLENLGSLEIRYKNKKNRKWLREFCARLGVECGAYLAYVSNSTTDGLCKIHQPERSFKKK